MRAAAKSPRPPRSRRGGTDGLIRMDTIAGIKATCGSAWGLHEPIWAQAPLALSARAPLSQASITNGFGYFCDQSFF